MVSAMTKKSSILYGPCCLQRLAGMALLMMVWNKKALHKTFFCGEIYEIHAYGYSKSEDDPEWLSFVKAKGGYTHDEIKALYDTSAIDDTSVRKELIKQCADTIGKESERSKELADKCNMLINLKRVNEEGKSSIGKREHHEVLRQNLKTIDNINNLLLSLPR